MPKMIVDFPIKCEAMPKEIKLVIAFDVWMKNYHLSYK